jgi:hypothetical protein
VKANGTLNGTTLKDATNGTAVNGTANGVTNGVHEPTTLAGDTGTDTDTVVEAAPKPKRRWGIFGRAK